MNKQRIAILIAAGVGMLATFLPWVKAPFIGSINGTQGDLGGWFTFVLYLVPVIIYIVGKQSEPIKGVYLPITAVISSLCASWTGFVTIYKLNSKMDLINSDNAFAKALTESVSIEVGLYLVVLAGIMVTIVVFFMPDQKAPNRMEQKYSPQTPNDKIKIKINQLNLKAFCFLVLQGIVYLSKIMNAGKARQQSDTADTAGNVTDYLIINFTFLLLAIIPFIRAYFLRRKLNHDKENENVDISAVQPPPNVSPPNPNTNNPNPHSEKISKLKELKDLLDGGILNQHEYDNEKAKILS